MDDGGRRWYGQVDRTHPHLREHVLEEIRARGPLGSRHFDGAARQGEMWGWKPAKQMLELLWNHGDLVVAGRQGFQRLYDVPERVLPAAVLDAPTPAEPERLRARAPCRARPRGAHRARDRRALATCGGTARIRATVASLVEEGELSGSASRTGAPTSSSRRARSSTGRGRRSRSSSRRSRTSSGTGRSHAASSASTT